MKRTAWTASRMVRTSFDRRNRTITITGHSFASIERNSCEHRRYENTHW